MFNDEYPTADSAEKWLSFYRWLKGKVQEMNDRFIQDFSSPWKGESDARPPKELHNETVALARKEQKGASTITIPGYQGSMDENGAVTIIQTGSHYILVNSSDTAAFRAMVNALIPAPDQPVVDLNDETTAWQGPPRTNSQMSMEQNELTFKYLKSKR